jgi:hypothetical protein
MVSGIGGLNTIAEGLIEKQHGEGMSNAHALAENLQMGASNRAYERKLKQVAKLRQEVKEAITRYDEMVRNGETGGTAFGGVKGIEMLNGYIELKLSKMTGA